MEGRKEGSTNKVRRAISKAKSRTARDISIDLHGHKVLRGAVGIDHARVRPRAVRIDLVQRHADLASLGDLREPAVLADYVRHGGRNVDGAALGRAAAPRGAGGPAPLLAPEDGRVLLEGRAPRAVAGSGRVDAERCALPAGVAGGGDDGAVGGDDWEGGGEKEEEGGGGSRQAEGEKHGDDIGVILFSCLCKCQKALHGQRSRGGRPQLGSWFRYD